MDIERIHTPVMLERKLELLAPASRPRRRDGRRHPRHGRPRRGLLERFPNCTWSASTATSKRWPSPGSGWRSSATASVVHTVYDGIVRPLGGRESTRCTGVLFDLGVSSLQLDRVERGFAYSKDAPLDMRMDITTGRTAADVIAEYERRSCARIFQRVRRREARGAATPGRSSSPGRGADHAVRPNSSTIIHGGDAGRRAAVRATPPSGSSRRCASRSTRSCPCCERAMPAALDTIAVGGRIVVLAYQSLEDRIVKRVAPGRGVSSTLPPGCRWSCPSTEPSSSSSCAAPSWRARPSRRRTRVRSPCGCVPPSE